MTILYIHYSVLTKTRVVTIQCYCDIIDSVSYARLYISVTDLFYNWQFVLIPLSPPPRPRPSDSYQFVLCIKNLVLCFVSFCLITDRFLKTALLATFPPLLSNSYLSCKIQCRWGVAPKTFTGLASSFYSSSCCVLITGLHGGGGEEKETFGRPCLWNSPFNSLPPVLFLPTLDLRNF